MADSGASRDALIAQFIDFTSSEPEQAQAWLSNNDWDLQAALENYHASMAGEQGGDENDSGQDEPGPRAGSGPSTSGGTQRKKFATLGDLSAGNSNPSNDDEESSDDQDFFAGGEKSGLAVQNPDDLKKKIIERARKNLERPEGDDAPPARSNFSGNAHTLGGDDAPSRLIEDPQANAPRRPERVSRDLHFWNNGFSIDDGPLYDTSEPQNARLLDIMRTGRAPLDVLNVTQNQEVDVSVHQHESDYIAPKKKYKPFSGSGQRLGSPVPSASDTPAAATSAPAQSKPAAESSSSSSSAAPKVEIDSSQPAVSIQIRLGDGTRLVSRFNTTHTVGDIYGFVNSSSAASRARGWVLMTTFPSKELNDHDAVIGETPELKKGGTVVQKWS